MLGEWECVCHLSTIELLREYPCDHAGFICRLKCLGVSGLSATPCSTRAQVFRGCPIGSLRTRYRVSSTGITTPDSRSSPRSAMTAESRWATVSPFVGQSKNDDGWLVEHAEREHTRRNQGQASERYGTQGERGRPVPNPARAAFHAFGSASRREGREPYIGQEAHRVSAQRVELVSRTCES
jgi:hypothetical protein